MNEFDVVLSWLASVVGGPDCGICNWLNNSFDNLLNLGIGVAGAAGAAAGTVVSSTTSAANRIGDAARDARDAFNANYDRASGGTGGGGTGGGGTPAAPPSSGRFTNRLRDAANRAASGGQFPAPPAGGVFGRGPTQSQPGQMPQGTLNYFNTGAPTGSQIGGEQ